MERVTPSADPLAAVAAGPSGPGVGAFFDLDGTLIAGFTATAHAVDRLRRGQARIGEILGVVEASLRYRFGRMEFGPLLVRAATYLRGESLAELERVSEGLFAEQVAERVYPLMRRLVDAHRERGHTLLLCSSALSIHARPAARHLGIDDVVCNTFELDGNGLLTGRVQHPIIWGDQKAAAVQHFCATRGVDVPRSYFYADGDEDLPLMALVGNPVPVNPRPGLAAVAAAQGWPVLQTGESSGHGGASALGHLPAFGRAAATHAWRRLTWRGAGRR